MCYERAHIMLESIVKKEGKTIIRDFWPEWRAHPVQKYNKEKNATSKGYILYSYTENARVHRNRNVNQGMGQNSLPGDLWSTKQQWQPGIGMLWGQWD